MTGDRIVQDDGVRQAEGERTGRKRPDRLADSRREATDENTVRIGQFDSLAALCLPRKERLEDPLRLGEMLLRACHIAPAVHWPARNALEDHDLAGAACRQGREDEVLADGRNQVEGNSRELRAWRHAGDVGQGESPLRS